MQNHFGIKDFVMLVLLIIIGISVWLSMVQGDRQWEQMQVLEGRLGDLETQLSMADSSGGDMEAINKELAQLRTAIISRPIVVNINSGSASTSDVQVSGESLPQVTEQQPSATDTGKDTSWARPGYEIEWQPPFELPSNPKTQPGFRVGDAFTEIFGAQPARITPYLSTDVYGRRVIDRVVESMAYYDPKTLKFRGMLADAWQFDPDGLWLRVHLNPRAKFSDGETVTAEDVRWTFMDFIKNPLIEAERSRALLDMVEDLEVIDEHTVEFTFNDALFTNLSVMGYYVLPKHFYSKFEESQVNQSTGLVMGSGPFKLQKLDPDDQWTPGEDIVLTRNNQYWAGWKAPLGTLRFKVVTDDLASLVAYRNGEGDMLTPTTPQFNQVPGEPGWEDENYTLKWINMRSGYSFIAWQTGIRNGKYTPFHDLRVRKGMTMILDRVKMIRDIWEGVGVVATGPNSPSSPASNPTIQPWPYDIDQARVLFKEAGWEDIDDDGVLEWNGEDKGSEWFKKGDEFQFEFTISTGGEIVERITSYIKGQCAKVGIRCEPRIVDWSIVSDALKTRDFDSLIMGWSASSPESDPKQIWHSNSIEDQGDNFTQWANADADFLIDQGRREMNYDTRMQIWHELHQIIHDEQPYTFLRNSPWLRFVKKRFGNVHEYKTGLEPQEFFSIGS
ncbi:MAG: hypothetical protein CMJ32_11780 [Phycisphaerae bacterium]|nr:hypothetical protein [Phycisphaerae bacterium]